MIEEEGKKRVIRVFRVVRDQRIKEFKVQSSSFKVQSSVIVGAGSACPFTKGQDSTATAIVIVIVKAIAIANSQSSMEGGGLRHPELVSGSDN